jgi:hypothetical protein
MLLLTLAFFAAGVAVFIVVCAVTPWKLVGLSMVDTALLSALLAVVCIGSVFGMAQCLREYRILTIAQGDATVQS